MTDFAFVNSCLMAAVVAVLMLVIFTLRRHLGARWIAWGFEALLLTVLLRRVDEIGLRFGVDLFDQTASMILSWFVVGVLSASFVHAWRRRQAIKRVEADLLARAEYLETMRRHAERGTNWDHQRHLIL